MQPGNSLLGSTIPEGATRIIKMDLQMNEAVTSEVLGNDENYNDFLEDLRDESNKVRTSASHAWQQTVG